METVRPLVFINCEILPAKSPRSQALSIVTAVGLKVLTGPEHMPLQPSARRTCHRPSSNGNGISNDLLAIEPVYSVYMSRSALPMPRAPLPPHSQQCHTQPAHFVVLPQS